MRFDPANFCHSLALYLVKRCAALDPPVMLVYGSTTGKSDLWIFEATESWANDPHVTIRTTPGSPVAYGEREDQIALQIESAGTSDAAAVSMLSAIFEGFMDGNGYPLRMTMIDAKLLADGADDGKWMIVGAMPRQRPGLYGRSDVKGKGLVLFNVDVKVRRPTQDEIAKAA